MFNQLPIKVWINIIDYSGVELKRNFDRTAVPGRAITVDLRVSVHRYGIAPFRPEEAISSGK